MEANFSENLSASAQQEAMASALERLPKIMQQYDKLEKGLDFITAVLNDKQSMQYLMNSFEKDLPEVNFNQETVHSIATLINKLPKFAKYAESAERLVDFGQAVLSDKQSMEYLVEGMDSLTAPIYGMAQECTSVLEEAKKKARKDDSPIGIFTLLRMLKDPTVQSGLQFMRAVLDVIETRKRNPEPEH